jgi:transposase
MMKARSGILGVERRRKWSPAEKAQFLEEALQPGVTVASVADRHGISRGLFYYWMGKARAGLLPGVSLNSLPTPRFVPVRLEQKDAPAAVPVPSKLPSPPRTGSGAIEIVFGNGRVLKVRESIDPAVLGKLADALDESGT